MIYFSPRNFKKERYMGKIVSTVNQKGGVGKTTTAVNLSAFVGKAGCKTLIIDVDPQGNTTSGLGINKRDIRSSSYELLLGDVPVRDTVIETDFDNLFVIPSNINLAGAEIELADAENRMRVLAMRLAEIKEEYDFIFLDCPPSLGLITINALTASDSVLIPIQCEYYALEGLTQLMNTVRTVKKISNPFLDIEGILLTMYDSRLNLTSQVVKEIKRYFPKQVYRVAIPRNVRLSESPSYGKPICYYDKHSKGCKAYREFSKEFLEKNQKSSDKL